MIYKYNFVFGGGKCFFIFIETILFINRITNKKKNMNKKELLKEAFDELEKLGYFARINFWCCNTCALADIPDDVEKFVFTHKQSHEDFLEKSEAYLNWAGNPQEIRQVLEKYGFETEHNGSENKKIFISLKHFSPSFV